MTAPRRAVAALLVATGLLGACSGDDDGADDPDGTTATTSAIVSDLIETGEQVCTDVADDVTVDAEAVVPPSVPQPGADILSVTATLDDEELSVAFELAGEPDVRGDYLVSVGLPNDFDGAFEIQVQADSAGVWGAELTLRTEGAGRATPMRDAQVFIGDTTLDLVVPRAALPPIGREQPLLYGSSSPVRDGDTLLTPGGQPTTDPAAAQRAFDDCITFGQ